MTGEPLVSVIIPTYNCAAYLDESIRSVLAQTYVTYEIIVVDDGSTDNTRTVLAPFWDRIHYVHQENRELSAARNTGIREARGDLIAFLDADDVWLPTKLELQVQTLQGQPAAGWAFADFLDFDDSGVTGGSRFSTWPGVREWFDRHRVGDGGIACGPMYVDLLKANWIHASSVMVRRNVLAVVGLFDEACRVGEDYDLWLRIAQRYPVLCLGGVLTGYRFRPQSMSGPTEARGVFTHQGRLMVLKKHLRNGSIPRALEGVVYRELSHHCWGLGWTLFGQNRFAEARKYFRQGICYQPLHGQLWMYWWGSFLPMTIIELVRRFRQWRRSYRLPSELAARNLSLTHSGPKGPRRTI